MKRLIPNIALAGAIFLTPAHAGPIDITAATGTTATQSSDFVSGAFPASNAIDGDTTTFTHTAGGDPAPTWTADFHRDIALGSLVIHNRDDCCGERLRDITVELLDSADNVLFTSAVLNPGNALSGPDTLTLVLPGPVTARKVRISRDVTGIPSGDVLSIGELQVFAPAPIGPVAHFPFDGDTDDASGNANHGTFVGEAAPTFTADRFGNSDSAISFDGIDDYLHLTQNIGLPLTRHTDFTISGWVKGAANQAEKRIFSEGSTTSGLPLYNLSTRSSTDQLDIFVRGDPGTGTPPVDHFQPPGTLYDDTWRHFTVIDRDGALTVFIDGVLQPGSPIYTRVSLTADTTTLGGILRAAASNFFAGALDDIRLYDSAVITVLNANDSGPGSLRQAIADAPSGATITFDPTALDGETITLTSGQFLLDKDVTIDASALSGGLTLDAQDASHIMFINGSNGAPSVSIHGLALTGGNNVSSSGGAIQNVGATLTLTHCTFFGNTAGSSGGAILSASPGASLALTHCTLTGNTATSGEGGAINAFGTLTLRHCTLTGNSANVGGGVDFGGSGTFTLENSIVAGNTGSLGADILIRASANLTRVGANIVQNFAKIESATDNGPTPINAAPLLAPFGDYGGPTPTMLPQPGSPAIDAALGFPGATDQRGLAIGDYVYENDFSTTDLGGATVFTSIADLLSPPVQPETGTVADGSFLFTGEVSNQVAALVLPAPPEAFTTFAASFDLSYSDPSFGTGSGGPADGISFSFGPAPAANTFGGPSGANAENGVPGTHRICLNTASFGGSPTFLRYIGPGNTTIASAPIDRFGDAGKVLPITVTLDAAGTLTVTYKGELAFTVPTIGYSHTPEDTFTFAARTGGDRSEQRVDNIRILTNPIGGAPDIGAVESGLAIPGATVVTSTADTLDGFENGISLREAITFAPPGATITFAQTLDGSTIALNGILPTINRNVTIDATALSGGLTLDAHGASSIMFIDGSNGSPSVSLHGLNLTGGSSPFVGGAIINNGATLALTHCTLFGNTAGSSGGAISSGGPGASLALTHCTLTGNTATGSSGAGGAILASGALTLRHCTLSGNTADFGGGVDFPGSGTFTLENSIVAGNTGIQGADIFNDGTLTPIGANLVQTLFSGPTVDSSRIITAAPLLAPLGDYGGPTPTMPPLPGSPAIDAGGSTSETIDQRGFPRSSGGSAPDIGAVELQQLLVTTAADEDNGDNDPAIGTGTSLREAIAHDSPVSAELITFAQTLNGGTITLGGTQLLLDKDVAIDASALSGGLTISGNADGNGTLDPGESRIFEVPTGKTVVLHALHLIDGQVSTTAGNDTGMGGAILTRGDLTLDRCLVADCRARFGGGISVGGGFVEITQSTLSGNSASEGGGISVGGGSVEITQSTLSGNSASAGGGIFVGGGFVEITQSTLSGNSASADGGGISVFGVGSVDITRSIVAGNLTGGDIDGSFTDNGSNLLSGAPLLAPLGNYGGPTQTMPPLPGSPAIDAAPGSTEPTDQRGFPRPVDGDGNATAIADIGAAEFTPSSDLAAFFGLDTDGDGNLFGVEFALGTDPNVSDAGNPRNLRLLPQPGGPMKLTFGRNQTAQPFMIWRLTRSTTLLPGSFDEIFRYDGPTSTATNTGTNSTINPTSFEITDPTPPIGKAFYRFEAVPAP